MKYLVTGGAGFLGSHLCDALVERGDEVICLDNEVTGSWKNVKHLKENKKFAFLKDDITLPLVVGDRPLFDVDAIFHLASPTAPVDCRLYPLQTLYSNIQGTVSVAKLAEKLQVPLLYTSSIRVKDVIEYDIGLDKCYIEAKRVGEMLCVGFGFKVARLGNVYGTRMKENDSRVIPTFIRNVKMYQPIEIRGDRYQSETFCYVDDIVKGLILFMDSKYTEVIEFGGHEVVTLNRLVEIVCDSILGSKADIEYTGNDCKKVVRMLPNIATAKHLLGWDPKISLEEGIKKVVEFFDNRVNANVHSHL
jgi:UDP-glucuronate decarboxylase